MVLQAMRRFPHDGPMQRYGCGVLGNLIDLSNEAREKLKEMGGTMDLLTAMQNFQLDLQVQLWALRLLSILIGITYENTSDTTQQNDKNIRKQRQATDPKRKEEVLYISYVTFSSSN